VQAKAIAAEMRVFVPTLRYPAVCLRAFTVRQWIRLRLGGRRESRRIVFGPMELDEATAAVPAARA